MASPTRSARPGDVLDLPEDEAAQRVASRQCVYVDAPAALGDPAQEPDTEPPGVDPAVDLSELTVAQLKEYAAKQEIDLDGASRKIEIIDRIFAVLAEREAEDGDGDAKAPGDGDGGD